MDQSPSSAFGRAAADRACVFWSFLLSLLQGNAVLLQDTNLLIHLVIALICISLDELVSDAIAVLTPHQRLVHALHPNVTASCVAFQQSTFSNL